MSDIEETNRAMEEHLKEKKTQDAVVATLCGLAFAVLAYVVLGTSGPAPSGGLSPTITTSPGSPVLGVLAGVVGGAVVGRFSFTRIRQHRRRRFWGL